MKILVIEPDEYYHPYFLEILHPLGEVSIATSGQQASNLLQTKIPDILVTELLLPDLSGYEFLQQLRSEIKLDELPVVIYTKVDNFEDVREALNLGVMGYLVKGQDSFLDLKKLLLNLSQVYESL